MPKYENFEIVVEKVGDVQLYAVNVRQACGGEAGDASSSFNLAEITTPPAAQGGAVVNDAETTRHVIFSGDQRKKYTVLLTDSLTKETAQQVGRKLSHALFKGEVLVLWGQCQQYCSSHDATLRVRLDLTRAPELAALPWEYMRLPGDSNFAALDNKVTLVRYLRTTDAIRPLKVIPPLRILVMAAMPVDLPQLATNTEITAIKQALAGLAGATIETVVLPQATGESLRTALEEAQKNNQPFHVFHFIGHGAFDEAKQEGVLLFEDEKRKSVAVGHEDLGRWLQPFRSDLRLMVLNACEGARLSPTNSYSSVAAKVMQITEIPAAIAMQFRITDSAAIVFAQAFYAQVATGANLERAVDTARLAVSNRGGKREEWATPVFYLRAASGHLLDVKVPTSPPNLAAHYDKLKSVLPTCKLVFFLGMNVNGVDRPYYESWEPNKGMGVPTAAEIISYLGRQHTITSPGISLAGLAQQLHLRDKNLPDEFEPFFGSSRIKSQKTSKLYRVLAQIVKKVTEKLTPDGTDRLHKGLLFVTTTYDNALEKAFGEAGINHYHLICYGRDDKGSCLFSHREYKAGSIEKVMLDSENMPNKYIAWRDSAPVILKLPGEVADDTDFAVTEDDFFVFASKPPAELIPADVLTQIKESRHLYLGYDLQNWTLRLLRSRICEGQAEKDKKGSYAVLFDENDDPNALFWKECEVSSAIATLEDYAAGLEQNVLHQLFKEVPS